MALHQIILVSRFLQITLASIALCFAIVSCVQADHNRDMGHYYQDPNGYLMMAAIMTLFDTAAFGIVGLLVILRPRVMEWWLMLVFDVLAFAAAIGAGKCIYENAYRWYGWDATLYVAEVFSYLCIAPIFVAIGNALYLYRQGASDEGQIRLSLNEEGRNANGKGNGNGATMQVVRQLEKRVEQLEAEARARS